MKNKEYIFLAFIVLLSAFLRLYKLDKVPVGLYTDELMFGYEAYSLSATGRDTGGNLLPLRFNPYNDPECTTDGIYAYLVMPFVRIFGLNEFGTRMASVFMGILTTALMFLLARELSDSGTALIAAFLTAILPWHIQYSRIAFEVIALPFFLTLSLYLFMLSVNKKPAWLIPCAISFAASMYSYSVSKLFIPLVLLMLLITYRRHFTANMKVSLQSFAAFLVFLLPLLCFLLFRSGDALSRFNSFSIFSKSGGAFEATKLFAKNLTVYFSPAFLFLKGDPTLRHSIRDFGMLYIFQLPLVLLGIYCCFRKREPKYIFLLLWLLIYPIPAGMTTHDGGHASRAITGLPVFVILSALGARELWILLKGNLKKILFAPLLTVILLLASWNVYGYLRSYFVEYPFYSGPDWEYGFKEAVNHVNSIRSGFDRIIVYDRPSMITRRITVAFFGKMNPADFRRNIMAIPDWDFVKTNETGIMNHYKQDSGNNLYLVRGGDLKNVVPEHIVFYPDGKIAYKIIKSRAPEGFDEIGLESGEMIARDGRNPVAHLYRGYYHSLNGNYAEAVAEYGHALKLKPGMPDALENRAIEYQGAGKYNLALADYDALIKARPSDHRYFISRGNIYLKQKQYDKSTADYLRAIELSPGNADAYLYCGTSYQKSGNYDKSLEYLKKSVELNPAAPQAYWNIAGAYWETGRWDEVIHYMKKVLELDPGYPGAQRYLSMAESNSRFSAKQP